MSASLPRQDNYQLALDRAWDGLALRSPGDLAALGAVRTAGGAWRLPVLEIEFDIDLHARRVTIIDGRGRRCGEPGMAWQILALHYLVAAVPTKAPERLVSFEEIPEARGYAKPYRERVTGRLCGTVGRDRTTFRKAAEAIGGQSVGGGDLAMRFVVFPRLPVTVVWYAGDDEFPPGANVLFEDCVRDVLVVEDIVVTAERLVSRLYKRTW